MRSQGLRLVLAAGLSGFPAARGAAPAADSPAVEPSSLLAADVLPDAQSGMSVVSADDGAVARVVTTGAEFLVDTQHDTVECRQRIGKERPVALIQFAAGVLHDLKVSHHSSGAALLDGPGGRVRINGDSLLMVQPGVPGPIRARILFAPDFRSRSGGSMAFLDPAGGVSFFEHGRCPAATVEATSDPVGVTWNWKAGDVLWAAVSPPKPFDWSRSVADRIVGQGSDDAPDLLPSFYQVRSYPAQGTTVLYLQNPSNSSRVGEIAAEAHQVGMKLVVAAPAFKDPDDGPIRQFKADGLSLELRGGPAAVAAGYRQARETRVLVGPAGLLYQRRAEEGPACPAVDAYFDVILGKVSDENRQDPAYLRYVLGTYNISNSISVLGADDRVRLDPQRIDVLIRYANARLLLRSDWFYTEKLDLFRRFYWVRLLPTLERELQPDLLHTTGVFAQARQPAGIR